MLADDLVIPALVVTLVLAVAMRAILAIYYHDGERILPLLKLRPQLGTVSYYKPLDTWFAPLPFVHCWLEVAAAVLVFRWVDYHPVAGMLLVVISAGRMRALQEVGHNALHAALCPSKSFQWTLSNLFFQFPVFKRDMHSRFVTHIKEHHPNADIPGKDPNHARIVAGGMVPGISTASFIAALLYPVMPRGFVNSVVTMLKAALFENRDARTIFVRWTAVACVVSAYLWLGGWSALLVGYIIPLVTLYPLFSWLSLLSKHRWHTPYVAVLDKRAHDYEHGRATDFTGFFGPVWRYLIFPMSDAYHLAHHIFPFVRTEYLPTVDRELKINEPRYTQYISDGLLFQHNGQHAALSELYDRMMRAPTAGTTPAVTTAE